jgi:pyrroline-5-carboxylate reductase
MESAGFIGGGNMGFALARAVAARFPQAPIWVRDVRPERVELFLQQLPGAREAASSAALASEAEVVVLAVKPQDLTPVLAEIRDTQALLVSICAGVPLRRLEAALPAARVVRVMPNVACLVGQMAAAYALGSRVRPGDQEVVEGLLGSVGYATPVEERLLDAVTGLSGSGPAFVARLIEAFSAAGERVGLPARVAMDLTVHTFWGTARLLAELGLEPGRLVEMVSSYRGTAVAGRKVLEGSDMAQVILATIEAATRRSAELGAKESGR